MHRLKPIIAIVVLLTCVWAADTHPAKAQAPGLNAGQYYQGPSLGTLRNYYTVHAPYDNTVVRGAKEGEQTWQQTTTPPQYGTTTPGGREAGSAQMQPVMLQDRDPQSQEYTPKANRTYYQASYDLITLPGPPYNKVVPFMSGGAMAPNGRVVYRQPPGQVIATSKDLGEYDDKFYTMFKGLPQVPGNPADSETALYRGGGLLTDAEAERVDDAVGEVEEEAKLDPDGNVPAAKASQEAQQQQASDAAGGAGQAAFGTGLMSFGTPLPNVANEQTGTPGSNFSPIKLYSQAIWMVQKMYKAVFLPMAILLLLPGAILTQTKALVAHGIVGTNDEDTVSPFTGILRAIIAIFLIPASQLVISYSTDVGNAMTSIVEKQIQPTMIFLWAQQQMFAVPFQNMSNQLYPPSDESDTSPESMASAEGGGGGGDNPEDQGKASNGSSFSSMVEQQSSMTIMMQLAYNILTLLIGLGLMLLLAFQIATMCYLFLMGPIVAALYAWPSGCGGLFKPVFANWVDGVINLSLWRFWWCVIVLCMQTRINWLQMLSPFQLNTQWEMVMFTAFIAMLTYVPFMPWNFKPGEMVSNVMNLVSTLQQAAMQGAGGGEPQPDGGGGGDEDGDDAGPDDQTDGADEQQGPQQQQFHGGLANQVLVSAPAAGQEQPNADVDGPAPPTSEQAQDFPRGGYFVDADLPPMHGGGGEDDGPTAPSGGGSLATVAFLDNASAESPGGISSPASATEPAAAQMPEPAHTFSPELVT